MSLSRNGSPSKGFRPVVHLDNLETLQGRWAKQGDGLRHPPPSPTLNSPRSLKACQLCGIDPERDLERYSLKQHLTRVLGDPSVDAVVSGLSEADRRAAVRTAVLAFQREGIGMGTTKEKLVAYRAFQHQEEQRVPRLAAARQVRRQMMTEDVYNTERRALSESPRAGGSCGSTARALETTTWSHSVMGFADSVMPAAGDRRPSREVSVQTPPKLTDVVDRPASPRQCSVGDKGRSVSPTSPGRSLNDYRPPLSSDGYPPFVPRNAASLNASCFGNRTFDRLVSNPSRAALSKTTSEGGDQTPGRRSNSSSLAPHDDPYRARRRSQHRRQESGGWDAQNDSVSVGRISLRGRNDLSTTSINSSQLGWLLCDPEAPPAGGGSTTHGHWKKSPAPPSPGQQPQPQPQPASTAAAPAGVSSGHDHCHDLQGQENTPAAAAALTMSPPPTKLSNHTSTPPRIAAVANLTALAGAKGRSANTSGDHCRQPPPQQAPAAAAVSVAERDQDEGPEDQPRSSTVAAPQVFERRSEALKGGIDYGALGTDFFLFCANPRPIPYGRVR